MQHNRKWNFEVSKYQPRTIAKLVYLVLLVIGLSQSVQAALKAAAIDTDTISSMDASDEKAIKIFAGLVVESTTHGTCANPSIDSVCDSCVDLSDLSLRKACNERSIHPNLEFAIEMTWDSVPTSASVRAKVSTQDGLIDPVISVTPAANKANVVRFRWSDICSAASSTNCQVSKKFDLYIGIDSGNGTLTDSQKYTVYLRAVDGASATTPTECKTTTAASSEFCSFEVYPGDAKVFVDEGIVRGASGPSDFSSIKWRAMRVFYKSYTNTPDFSLLTPAEASYKDLEISTKDSTEVKIDDPRITGLENNTTYMFLIASVDEAYNVTGFFSTSSKIAQPGEVVGLLDGTDCFIATAAYGSKWDASVQTLRNFRSQILLRSDLGHWFVQFYYRHSPKLAAVIVDNEFLKASVRVILTPIVWIAEFILWIGLWQALVAVFLLPALVYIVRRRLLKGVQL